MVRPDSRPRVRGRGSNFNEERIRSNDQNNKTRSSGELESSIRSSSDRRRISRTIGTTSMRKITMEVPDNHSIEETANHGISGRRRRHRDEIAEPSRNIGTESNGANEERQRKKRRQGSISRTQEKGRVNQEQVVDGTSSSIDAKGDESNRKRLKRMEMIDGDMEVMGPPKSFEPRRSDSKAQRREDQKESKRDDRIIRYNGHDFYQQGDDFNNFRLSLNHDIKKERHSEPRDSQQPNYEPVRLCPRNESQSSTGFCSYGDLPFIPQSPNPYIPGPPDPFLPPSTTAQLRILILISFLGTQLSPPPNLIINPELPLYHQRLICPCPMHSVLVTKHLKEFFSFHRHLPNSFLRCFTHDLIATQLLYLSLPQNDPFLGVISSPIKIELIPGGIIVETFDFIRSDRLIRSAMRPDHPTALSALYDRHHVLSHLPNDLLDSKSDYINGFYSECENFFNRQFDDGLPAPAPKSVPLGSFPSQSQRGSASFDNFEFNQFSLVRQHLLSSLGAPMTIASSTSVAPSAMQVFPTHSASTFSKKAAGAVTGTNIEELLNAPSAKEKQIIDSNAELRDLLTVPTAKHSLTTRSFQSRGGSKVQQICPHGTRQDCLDDAIQTYDELKLINPHLPFPKVCNKIHFRRIIFPHTDLSLGDCSYLDTCRHMASCRFVHYEVDLDVGTEEQRTELLDRMEDPTRTAIGTVSSSQLAELPAQWITCDIRKLDWTIFKGKVKIVMADPPWDIHMDLPYGTMTDAEMKSLRLDQVQDEGLLFLWVTGRAMELGRECMQLWGYKRVEEIVWVKTNQLHRVIRTGRTGHWLNHSKEHCLVGIKGEPKLNRHLDTDLIVAEVRETSRKPDEVYRIIERLCPGPYKLELFGRPHNVRNNWITLGNQLDGIRLHDAQLIQRYKDFANSANLPPYDPTKEQTKDSILITDPDTRSSTRS